MATWEDGPEYAPAERPSGFTQPPVEPLDVAPPREPSSAETRPVRPQDYAPQGSERPLSSYQPELGPSRDPSAPFDVARTTLTEVDSAWGLVHHYHVDADGWAPNSPRYPDPRTPIHAGTVHPAGGPGAGVQLTGGQPPSGQLTGGQPEPLPHSPVQAHWGPPEAIPDTPMVTFGAVFNAVTVPTFATLLIGGLAIVVPFFSWLSPLMFILAFATSTQIDHRPNLVRNTFLVASGALGATVLAGAVLSGGNLQALLDLVTAISTATCWIVLAALLIIMWQALGAGEQPAAPDPTPRGWG